MTILNLMKQVFLPQLLESITKDKKYTCESASDMKYNYFLEEYLVAQRNILTL